MASQSHDAQPAPVYQVPEWETHTKRSLLSRLLASIKPSPPRPISEQSHARTATPTKQVYPLLTTTTTTITSTTTTTPTTTAHPSDPPSKEPDPTSTLAADPPPRLRPAWHARLDALLPPHRLYLGRRRRPFLTLLALLLLLSVLTVLALAAGLTAARRRQQADASPAPLPLPLPPPDGAPGSASAPHAGALTHFAPGLGACGREDAASALVVAVAARVFDALGAADGNPNHSRACGRVLRVWRAAAAAAAAADGDAGADTDAGRNVSVEVRVADRCRPCGVADLDLSPAAFGRLAPLAEGRVAGWWEWLAEE